MSMSFYGVKAATSKLACQTRRSPLPTLHSTYSKGNFDKGKHLKYVYTPSKCMLDWEVMLKQNDIVLIFQTSGL